MNCEWREKVILYADDELDPATLGEVAAHLRDCRECSAVLLEHLQMKKLVRVAGRRFTAPQELRNSLRQNLHATDRRPLVWRWSFASIGLLLIIAVGLLFLSSRVADPVLGELVDQHVTTLASANPVDVVSSDRHTVKPWFQGKVPFTFNSPELANSPFTLLGGKGVFLRQSPGVELLYEIRKHKISVFIFQADQPGLAVSGPGRGYSFTIEHWDQGSLRFYLVTDVAKQDADQLISMFRSANGTE